MSAMYSYNFSLPRGYPDAAGQVHKNGTMRLATALDEIEAVADRQVQANPATLPLVLLSRVITRLGDLPGVTPQVVGGLFAADLAYLEDLYLRLNSYGQVRLETVCPNCGGAFQVQVAPLEVD